LHDARAAQRPPGRTLLHDRDFHALWVRQFLFHRDSDRRHRVTGPLAQAGLGAAWLPGGLRGHSRQLPFGGDCRPHAALIEMSKTLSVVEGSVVEGSAVEGSVVEESQPEGSAVEGMKSFPGTAEVRKAARFLGRRLRPAPLVGIVLGSGLGSLAARLSKAVHIP